ncbi:acyltransferase [Pantoea dispersa]|uniref:acyltransferase family protein n=1 Tax=Pantoea dispersa TaxID=59814 RepID=UPI0021AE451B|nr:acyltransferase [Pantoea dispersa]MCT6588735.1 acyltransferase [Pantoea dispersa]
MRKISYLEGLRGICCFIVIFDHCINTFKPDLRFTGLSDTGGIVRQLIAWTPLNIIYSGIAPVCIFFILSGFVLSIKYNNTKMSDVIYQGVIKRYPRLIFPILIAMLLMYLAYEILESFTTFSNSLSFSKAITEAIYTAPFYHVNLTNYALWTISFEIYGSLLVFSLLAIFGEKRGRLFFYILTFCFLYLTNSFYSLFVLGIILSDIYVNRNYRIIPSIRVVLFLIGLILSTSPYPRNGVEVYGGLYSYLRLFNVQDYNQLYQMLMLTGSSLIFISILGSSFFEKLFNLRLFQYLGKISFPLYITHVTVLSCGAYYVQSNFPKVTIIDFILISAVMIMICFMISSLFEKYIDAPAIKFANKMAKKLN